MNFKFYGLDGELFSIYSQKSNAELEQMGAIKVIAGESFGYPCRVTLNDAAKGDELYLLNFAHLDNPQSPFAASHAIFVKKNAKTKHYEQNVVPPIVDNREFLALRSFDHKDMMLGAVLTSGKSIAEAIHLQLQNQAVAKLHVHNAARGCYLAEVRPVR